MTAVLNRLMLFVALVPALALADKPTDTRALAGMNTGQILWDITLADPKRLIARLDVIEETHQDMVRQGLKPKMVFAFRGGAAGLIAKDTSQLEMGRASKVERLHDRIAEIQQLNGTHMEACSIATRRFDLEQNDLLPGITLVGNTFLSIMGYENQGFATIWID
jgi:intracellular sulfur oxidation DsrE/DsrF family protein